MAILFCRLILLIRGRDDKRSLADARELEPSEKSRQISKLLSRFSVEAAHRKRCCHEYTGGQALTSSCGWLGAPPFPSFVFLSVHLTLGGAVPSRPLRERGRGVEPPQARVTLTGGIWSGTERLARLIPHPLGSLSAGLALACVSVSQPTSRIDSFENATDVDGSQLPLRIYMCHEEHKDRS